MSTYKWHTWPSQFDRRFSRFIHFTILFDFFSSLLFLVHRSTLQKCITRCWNDQMRWIDNFTSTNIETNRIEHIDNHNNRHSIDFIWRFKIDKYCKKSSTLVSIRLMRTILDNVKRSNDILIAVKNIRLKVFCRSTNWCVYWHRQNNWIYSYLWRQQTNVLYSSWQRILKRIRVDWIVL